MSASSFQHGCTSVSNPNINFDLIPKAIKEERNLIFFKLMDHQFTCAVESNTEKKVFGKLSNMKTTQNY